MKRVKAGKYTFDIPEFKNISEQAKDLISKLLIYDPEKRISAEEALQHTWITDNVEVKIDQNLAQGALANLKTFKAEQKLKQATFAYIASQLLSKGEKDNLSKLFKAIDTNGDGKLSKEEILIGYDKYFGKHMNEEDIT
jgi:calcium-dependent protein kinase